MTESKSAFSALVPTVFVVDDDVSVRESLEFVIQDAGWRPELFASAGEFLAASPSDVPSCLVLDMTLPGLTGLDLQKTLAADRPTLPIIFLTGYGDVPKTVQAMKAGAYEFLTKLFETAELLSAIQGALNEVVPLFAKRWKCAG
jgi:FixJ family two-component response regulator